MSILTGILITLIVFSTLFIFIGRILLIIPNVNNKISTSLIVSSSYFVGMAFFLSIWRTFSFITDNALISLIGTLIFSVLIIYFFSKLTYKSFFFEFLGLIKSKWYLLISLFIFLFVGLYWLGSFKELNPFTTIGSLHSPRYANFATYILEFNRIPILGQNYGQSMLAAIPMILGVNRPLLALNLWLSITLINFLILTYSLFLYLNFTVKFSILATFLILFGNTAISFFHILCIDSGSPFILNGYTDSIASIGTFIVVLFFLKHSLITNLTSVRISVNELMLVFAFSIFWNMAAPQNSIFFGGLVVLFLILAIIKRDLRTLKAVKILILFVVFSGIGILEGGMYTPMTFKEKIVLPGLMEVGTKGLALNPGIPFHLGIGGYWEYGNKNLVLQSVEIKKQLKSSPSLNVALPMISVIEGFVTNSLKVIFWPLIGILGLSFLMKLNSIKYGDLLSSELVSDYRKLIFTTFFVFLIGIVFNLFVSVSGYKWELSRFLILGYFLGMFCLAIFLNFLFESKILSKGGIYFVLIFITIGPFINVFAVILINVIYMKNSIGFFDKVNLLFNTFGMIK